jgi:hypothetical protein
VGLGDGGAVQLMKVWPFGVALLTPAGGGFKLSFPSNRGGFFNDGRVC